MNNYVLFDDESWHDLLPLTFTRPCCEIRIGILTIREKWQLRLKADISFKTQDYLSEKFSFQIKESNPTVYINGRVCPDETLISEIKRLKVSESLYVNELLVAFKEKPGTPVASSSKPVIVKFPWDIFRLNAFELEADFSLLTKNRKSMPVPGSNKINGKGKIFLEKGSVLQCSTLNPLNGPIYLAQNSVIMEGCLIRGGFSLGVHSELKMGAKIYGPTTIGPYCKAGGEVSNSILFGYTNKAHDGFLGNSVLGEWCNLGADTNTSNLKNNYAEVKAWSYTLKKLINTNLQFCGLIMGDHSKTGINSMLNTGSVMGVNVNVYGGGFPPVHLPSFSWWGNHVSETYEFDKACEVARRVMGRRKVKLEEADLKILRKISEGKL